MNVAKPYFGIRVVDESTGRGVPLVELRTTNDIALYTDSAGWVAFHEPGLMDREVWFSVKSHGYEAAADGFGFRGARLKPVAGETATVRIKRLNVAERLYRITGEGIYRDSLLLGLPTPMREPLLNGRVVGQDSVLAVPYRGRIFWFWGDTSRPEYPLGHFGTAGATSAASLDPEKAIDLTYFVGADGFSRPMLPIDKPGPVWVSGVATIEKGTKLICFYNRVKGLEAILERGLAVYDDAAQRFRVVAQFDVARPLPLGGHPFLHTMDGKEWLVGTREDVQPLPCVRVPATLEALKDLSRYEVFDGAGWRVGAQPKKWKLKDRETGAAVTPHNGSVFWNAYRMRWVMIVGQHMGKASNVGEIWYAEAPATTGPWDLARRVVTHDRYDFYNPTQHPFLDRGRYLYFEGTYVNTFSGNPEATPRYNYNQILYRLDLDDPRLTA